MGSERRIGRFAEDFARRAVGRNIDTSLAVRDWRFVGTRAFAVGHAAGTGTRVGRERGEAAVAEE